MDTLEDKVREKLQAAIKQEADRLLQEAKQQEPFSVLKAYMKRYPLSVEGTSGVATVIVEGTLTPVIDDPARLLADRTQK